MGLLVLLKKPFDSMPIPPIIHLGISMEYNQGLLRSKERNHQRQKPMSILLVGVNSGRPTLRWFMYSLAYLDAIVTKHSYVKDYIVASDIPDMENGMNSYKQ